jgi:outer membrane PBP1 activator LpoA protein
MRSLFRNLVPLFLASVLAASLVTTGCRSQTPSQDDSYLQWEHETHREHLDVDKRSAEERKQYDDWRHSHQNHR